MTDFLEFLESFQSLKNDVELLKNEVATLRNTFSNFSEPEMAEIYREKVESSLEDGFRFGLSSTRQQRQRQLNQLEQQSPDVFLVHRNGRVISSWPVFIDEEEFVRRYQLDLLLEATTSNSNIMRPSAVLPSDKSEFFSSSIVMPFKKSTPSISWSTPIDIQVGTTLSVLELNAVCNESVDGVFFYKPPIGTKLEVGSHVLTVEFVPKRSFAFEISTASVTVNVVMPIDVTIKWSKPDDIVYDSPLSSLQLNAELQELVEGDFIYEPGFGVVLPVATHKLMVKFVPKDSIHYNIAATYVYISVTYRKISESFRWDLPVGLLDSPIVSGTPLGREMFCAKSDIDGIITYDADETTVLPCGSHKLTAIFSPSDSGLYSVESASVRVTVIEKRPSNFMSQLNSFAIGGDIKAESCQNFYEAFMYECKFKPCPECLRHNVYCLGGSHPRKPIIEDGCCDFSYSDFAAKGANPNLSMNFINESNSANDRRLHKVAAFRSNLQPQTFRPWSQQQVNSVWYPSGTADEECKLLVEVNAEIMSRALINSRALTADFISSIEGEDTPITWQSLAQNGLCGDEIRRSRSDSVIQALTFVTIVLDLYIILTIFSYYYASTNTSSWFWKFNLCLIIFSLCLLYGCLHYKLQNLVFGVYKLIMNIEIDFRKNNKYYSGCEIPDVFLLKDGYKTITIQMPVYDEDFNSTIKPTLNDAMKHARRYHEETGVKCNIIICDDGLVHFMYKQAELQVKRDSLKMKREQDLEGQDLSDGLAEDLEAVECEIEKYEKYWQERLAFYKDHREVIGVSARPPNAHLERQGRFKKAGNLNFSMNFSPVYCDLLLAHVKKEKLIKYREMKGMGALFRGNLQYGDFIFLIDADTRFPDNRLDKDITGCFKAIMKDFIFDGDDVLYGQCFTAPFLASNSVAEKAIFHSTCHIYNSILVATALGGMAPLVGHNVMLNHKIVKEVAPPPNRENYIHYWSEDRVSEDFDLMMRGCVKNKIGRYIASAGIFYEGVSQQFEVEYCKLGKFAFGAAELTFSPFSKWKENILAGLGLRQHLESDATVEKAGAVVSNPINQSSTTDSATKTYFDDILERVRAYWTEEDMDFNSEEEVVIEAPDSNDGGSGIVVQSDTRTSNSEGRTMNTFGENCKQCYLMLKTIAKTMLTFFVSPDFIAFWSCDAIEWYNKFNMTSYLLNFVAIGLAIFGGIWNLLWFKYYYETIPVLLMPTSLLFEGMIFWTIICTLTNLIFCSKAKFKHDVVVAQQLRESLFTGVLYGAITVRFFKMYLYFFLDSKVDFKPTSKDSQGVFKWKENWKKWCSWVWVTKFEFGVYAMCAVLIFLRLIIPWIIPSKLFIFQNKSLMHTFYFGCLPLCMQIFSISLVSFFLIIL